MVATAHVPDAAFELWTSRYAGRHFLVLRVHGVEEVSAPYTFDITVRASDLDLSSLEADLLGQRACLTIHAAGALSRRVAGVLTRVETTGRSAGADEGQHLHRLRLAPRLRLLRENQNSRIFQGLTVQQIVERVLADSQVPCRFQLTRPLAPRAYCVQYQESDLAFVQRILAEEGISYHFDHPAAEDGAEQVVLVDDTRAASPIDGSQDLRFWDSAGMAEADTDVRRFTFGHRARPTSALVRHFDFLRPSSIFGAVADLQGAAASALRGLADLAGAAPLSAAVAAVAPIVDAIPPARGAAYTLERAADLLGPPTPTDDPLFRYYEHHSETEPEGAFEGAARRRLEERRALAAIATGESRCSRLVPGRSFELHGAAVSAHDGRYTILRVEHFGVDPRASSGGEPSLAGTGGMEVYRNQFECVPAGVPFRPRRKPRKLQQVMETATVVGPPGQEIHTDSLGRIRVQFHWDRQGRHNEHSSCWIRVMQAWAGAGWGFQFIPRVGMEALVTFVGGDVDRPMVIGCAYNAERPPPFPLPREKTRSGIRTQSSKGGNGQNELSFEDRAGYEQIYLHAQKDLEVHVRNNATSRTGAHRTEVTEGNRYEITNGSDISTTGGDKIRLITGSVTDTIHQNRTAVVQGLSSERVGGDATEEIAGARRVQIGDGRAATVRGHATDHIGGDRLASVIGSDTLVIGGGSTTRVAGGRSVNVAGNLTSVVGTTDAEGNAIMKVHGEVHLSASGAVRCEGDEIALTVGESRIVIGQEEIRVESKKLVFGADEIELIAKSATLAMGDDADLQARNVKISSEGGAALNLDQAARLGGPTIQLGSAAAAERAARESRSASRQTDTATIKLFDRAGRLIRGAHYEVSFPGYLDRGTAASGEVRVPRFADVESCQLRWGRPQAEREPGAGAEEMEFESEIFLRDDHPDEAERVRRKLHNLGFSEPTAAGAAYRFQTALGVSQTLDPADVQAEANDRHDAARPITRT